MLLRCIRAIVKRVLLIVAHSEAVRDALRQALGPIEQIAELKLITEYKSLAHSGIVLPFHDVEFRCHSQNGEDGLLLYLFSLIGTPAGRSFVEIGCGDGRECNAANLAINLGWQGVFFDGDVEAMQRGQTFYNSHPNTFCWPPKCIGAWITRDNVNHLVHNAGYSGEVDFLSIDIDGMDYWIWDALTVVSPRAVMIEYQTRDAPDLAVVTPYADYFSANGEYRHGASLLALVNLAAKKGYRLIGTQRYCFNAIFLRNDVGREFFREVSVKDCLSHPKAASVRCVRPGVVNP
jgi:hypothetical protein